MKFLKRLPLLALLFAFLIGCFAFSASAVYYPEQDGFISLVHNGEVFIELPVVEAETWMDLYNELGPQDYSFRFDAGYVGFVGDTEYQILDYQGVPVDPYSRIIGAATYYLSLKDSLTVSFTGDDGRPEIGFDLIGYFEGFKLIEYYALEMEFELERIGTAMFVLHDDKIALSVSSDLYSGQRGLYYLQKSYGDMALINDPAAVLEMGPAYYLVRVCGGSHPTSTWLPDVEATCDTSGVDLLTCDQCLKPLEARTAPALGHDRGFLGLGACSRCGAGLFDGDSDNLVVDIGNGITNWWDDITGGSSGGAGGSNELPTWVQDIMDFFEGDSEENTDWFSEFNASVDKFLNTVKVIGILIVGIIVLPYLLKGVAWVWKRLAEAFEDIGGFFKNISKSARKKAAGSGK